MLVLWSSPRGTVEARIVGLPVEGHRTFQMYTTEPVEEEWLGTFLGEARRAGTIAGPRVPHVVLAQIESEVLNVQGWLPDGVPLAHVQDELDLEPRLALVADLADALAAAHGVEPPVLSGPIEIKHVWYTPEGAILTNVGLGQMAHVYDDQLHNRSLLPLALRRSPEELLGRTRSAAADVFFLGMFLHELVTGRDPYPARRADTLGYYEDVRSGTFVRPGSAAPHLNRDLCRLIERCLSVDPLDRPSERELAATLRRLATG